MKHTKGLIGLLVLSAALLGGCHSGSSGPAGPCTNSFTYCELKSVAYGAGEFVAVGWAGNSTADHAGGPRIEVSTDGINWTSETVQYTQAQLDQANFLQSITYGSNGFVTTDGVHVLHSTDGLNWTVESFQDPLDKISYVIYDGTRYILYSHPSGPITNGPDNFPWKVSTDGVSWSGYGAITVTNGPAGEPVSIIHVAGMYEAAWQAAYNATASTVYLTATSKDGLSWTLGNPAPVTYIQYPAASVQAAPVMVGILHTGDQYILFGGGGDRNDFSNNSWGLALHGSSMSTMTMTNPLAAQNSVASFIPIGAALFGISDGTHGLVSNGAATVGLGQPGLFVTTDGSTWNYQSLEGVVPETGCNGFEYPGGPICTAFSSGAAAPGGPIVVLTAGGSSGATTTDGIHWVTSNL